MPRTHAKAAASSRPTFKPFVTDPGTIMAPWGLATLVACTALLTGLQAQWTNTEPFQAEGFVRVQDAQFVDGQCQDFILTGWNSFQVIEAAMVCFRHSFEASSVHVTSS